MNADVHTVEQTLASILIQLIIIILAAKAAGSVAARLRQPRAVGEIVAGLMLGPSFLGHFFPEFSAHLFPAETGLPLTILAQIGLILLMFQIGSDFEFGHLDAGRNKRAVLVVALFSVAFPAAAGLALGYFAAPVLAPGKDALAFSLFMGVALAITAVPILGRILSEWNLTRTEIGVIAISAAAANDVVGWVALACVAALVTSAFSWGALGALVAGLSALMAGLWFVGRPAADRLVRHFPVRDGQVPSALVAIVFALVFAAGITTQALGIFTIFGGFLVGLLFHKHTAFVEAWRNGVGQFVFVFFLPIFFTLTGLRTDLLGLDTAREWIWCGGIFAAAVLSKLIPVYLAGRISGLDKQQSLTLGVLMNTRALMELIVLNVGFSLGVLPREVFTMLVLMAVGSTLMTGPLLNLIPQMRRDPAPQAAEAA